jgi:ankyrin repeat protein
MFAIADNNITVIMDLLQAGHDINIVNGKRVTPLMSASFGDRLDVLRFLLEQGADVNIRSKRGKTALTYTTNPDVQRVFLAYYDRFDELGKKELNKLRLKLLLN